MFGGAKWLRPHLNVALIGVTKLGSCDILVALINVCSPLWQELIDLVRLFGSKVTLFT